MLARAIYSLVGWLVWLITLLIAAPLFSQEASIAFIAITILILIPIREDFKIALCAACSCLLPALNFSLITLLWGGIYLNTRRNKSLHDVSWMLPFAGLIAIWWLSFTVYRSNLSLLDLWRAGDFGPVYSLKSITLLISAFTDGIRPAWLSFVSWLLFGALVTWFAERDFKKESFSFGILIGLSFALVALFMQLNVWPSFIGFPQFNQFWHSLSRYPSTFSDPNACGIFVFLAIALLGSFSRLPYKALLLVAIALLGAFSGSRTFFLGIIFLLAVMIYRWRRNVFYLFCSFALIFIFLVSVYDLESIAADWLRAIDAPTGVIRITEALSIDRLSQTLFSRTVFVQILAEVIREHFVYGIGPGEFYKVVPFVAEHLGLGIGAWADNSNNFYLGILAELGIIGLLAFVFACSRLEWKNDFICGSLVIVVALLLFLGPHLDFPEVGILFAFILAQATKVKVTPLPRWIFPCFCIWALPIIGVGSYADFGLFMPEGSGKDKFEWSSSFAAFDLNCSCDGNSLLLIEAPQVPLTGPVAIEVQTPLENTSYTLVTANAYAFPLECAEHSSFPGVLSRKVRVQLKVKNPWTPALRMELRSQDWRLLGVKRLIGREQGPQTCW